MEIPENRTFGKTLKALREEQCMTQRELAVATGFSYETIRSWEYGRKKPINVITLKRLIDGLEFEIESAEADALASALGQDVGFESLFRQLYKVRATMR